MKNIDIFDGNKLHTLPVPYDFKEQKCTFLGIDENENNISLPLDLDLLSKHIMFLGGIGTGKTNAFSQMISQILDNIEGNDIMIIFDTKGDFYEAFHEKAAQKHGYAVISNDDTSTGVDGVDYWNIFNEIPYETEDDKRRMKENILEVSNSLFSEKMEKTNQPFFPTAAKDIFGAAMRHFIRSRDTLRCDNKTLKAFLDKALLKEYHEMLESHDDMRAFINYIAKDGVQTQGVLSEIRQVVESIFIGNFEKAGTLSLRNLVREKGGRVVFIEYDIGVGSMLSPIYSLLFDMAIKEALGRKKSERGNVYFITDEFRLLPNLQHIDNAVNFGRGLGIKFMIGVQNVDQLYECYGEHRARSIMSGFLTSVAFRVNDEPSRSFIKERYGQNRKKETYASKIGGKAVENIREAYVVEDWDISNLEIGEAIIGLPGKEPFKFQFKEV